MNTSQLSRLRRLLQLAYPVRVVCSTLGVRASFPDLEGVEVTSDDIATCYARLEAAKRLHLTSRLEAGLRIAPPNSHLPLRLTRDPSQQPA